MRKWIVSLITVVLALSCLSAPSLAAEGTFTQDGYTYEYMRDGNLKLLECDLKDTTGEINIPDQIGGHHVTSIAEYAFDGCKMSKVTIPDTVEVIYSFAFNNCTNIQKILIPEKVFYIDGNPFTGCTSLVNIDVRPTHETLASVDGVLYSKLNKALLCYPCAYNDSSYKVANGILKIGKSAFYGCDNLVSITLPTTVKEIEANAFSGCSKLEKILLPDSLLTIGELAFAGCVNLERITIPTNVSRIEKATFFNCSSMTSVVFPENLTVISDRAFYGCSRLKTVTLHENVTTIGEEAFYGCQQLTNVDMPVAVTKIGEGAFDNCSPRLYLQTSEKTFTQIYAEIYGISYKFGNEGEFLNAD